jgi:hypothetical protein
MKNAKRNLNQEQYSLGKCGMANDMDLESRFGLMGLNMKEIGKMTKLMEKESFGMQTGISLKV